ncbi:hypothetical protein EJ04DRAFT_250788 [Polyplosphaeria fusca]|uniref:Uncharacterized protein n=1 Tax=Polyplosphaeria fusca TaxID=682080 RepID=A0A9P4UZF2_9PLEO|nr:hypothetical protein EJ04DRAFT_250788 [Polyplosphaeria fusca]
MEGTSYCAMLRSLSIAVGFAGEGIYFEAVGAVMAPDAHLAKAAAGRRPSLDRYLHTIWHVCHPAHGQSVQTPPLPFLRPVLSRMVMCGAQRPRTAMAPWDRPCPPAMTSPAAASSSQQQPAPGQHQASRVKSLICQSAAAGPGTPIEAAIIHCRHGITATLDPLFGWTTPDMRDTLCASRSASPGPHDLIAR